MVCFWPAVACRAGRAVVAGLAGQGAAVADVEHAVAAACARCVAGLAGVAARGAGVGAFASCRVDLCDPAGGNVVAAVAAVSRLLRQGRA